MYSIGKFLCYITNKGKTGYHNKKPESTTKGKTDRKKKVLHLTYKSTMIQTKKIIFC